MFLLRLKRILQKPLSRRLVIFFFVILVLGSLFFIIHSVSAGTGLPSASQIGIGLATGTLKETMDSAGTSNNARNLVAEVLSYALLGIVHLLGKALVAVIDILIQIAGYNSFGDAPAITKGWTIVRDVCNMFFIAVFINMAFYTVLKWQDYHYSKVFSKIILMAILINFSKGITLFFIDFSQVIMMTFVNAFSGQSYEYFTSAAGLEKLLAFDPNAKQAEIGTWPVFLALLLAVIMVVIYLVTVVAVLLVLLTRIITLWLLIVLSPLAYLASVFPKAEKYSGQWWSKFGEQLFRGPVLAFFLWLSFTIVATNANLSDTVKYLPTGAERSGQISAAVSGIGASDKMLSFILMVALLLMALAMTSQMGGMAGTFAQGAMRKLQSAGTAPLKLAGAGVALGMKGLGASAKWGGRRLDNAQAGLQQRLASSKWGQRLGKTRFGKKIGIEQIQKHGIAFRSIRGALAESKRSKEVQRLGESASVAQDIINRATSFGRDQTDYATLARAARVGKAQQEIAAGGEEKELLIHRLNTEYLDKNGKVKKGKEAEAEGLMKILIKNHDINEALKSPKVAGNLKKHGKGAAVVGQQGLQLFLKHAFGDVGDTKRIAKNLEELGLAHNDAWVKGITHFDEKKGTFEWSDTNEDWRKDEGAVNSAAYNKKRKGREFAGSQRRQDYYAERADEDGNLHFREISNVGKQNLTENVDDLLKTNLEHFGGEFLDSHADNLDLLIEWKESGDLNEGEADKLQQWIEKVASRVMGIPEADFKREKDPKERERIVQEAIKRRHTPEFVEKIQTINDNRKKNEWDEGGSYKGEEDLKRLKS